MEQKQFEGEMDELMDVAEKFLEEVKTVDDCVTMLKLARQLMIASDTGHYEEMNGFTVAMCCFLSDIKALAEQSDEEQKKVFERFGGEICRVSSVKSNRILMEEK